MATPVLYRELTSLQKLVRETVLKNLVGTDAYIAAQRALANLQEQVEASPYTAQLETRLNETIQSIFPGISLMIRNIGEQDFSKIVEKQTIIQAVEENRPQVGLEYHGHGVRRHFILSAYRNWADPLASTKKRGKKTDEDWQLPDDTQEVDRKVKMLLIEEPELFLHPAAMRAVQRLLYELADHSEFQIMCSTHAPIMVCIDRPHSSLVRMVPDTQFGAAAYQVEFNLFDDDEKNRLRMLKEFNPYICEAFFADRVLLVEGDTEAIVVRTLLERMRENGDLDYAKDVCVVNCGSKMNIPLFQRILRHFHIPYFVFHDLDRTYNRDGKRSAAWTLNERIWEEIRKAEQDGLAARRFVFERNLASTPVQRIRRGWETIFRLQASVVLGSPGHQEETSHCIHRGSHWKEDRQTTI